MGPYSVPWENALMRVLQPAWAARTYNVKVRQNLALIQRTGYCSTKHLHKPVHYSNSFGFCGNKMP